VPVLLELVPVIMLLAVLLELLAPPAPPAPPGPAPLELDALELPPGFPVVPEPLFEPQPMNAPTVSAAVKMSRVCRRMVLLSGRTIRVSTRLVEGARRRRSGRSPVPPEGRPAPRYLPETSAPQSLFGAPGHDDVAKISVVQHQAVPLHDDFDQSPFEPAAMLK
jgi:hypothetical protein